MENSGESSEDRELNIFDRLHESIYFSAEDFQIEIVDVLNVCSLTLPLKVRNVLVQTKKENGLKCFQFCCL